jgi:cytochrome c oxidase subunit III
LANHGVLWHHFDDLRQQHQTNMLGMWMFLSTELLIFGALFTGYSVYRSMAPYNVAFEAASGRLNILIGGINTLVLLTSSLTMALSVWAAQVGRRQTLVTCLLLTAALGTLFMVFKAVEYYTDYRDQLVPGLAFNPAEWQEKGINPGNVQLFLLFYYVMTGLHALHLTIGITIVLVLAYLAWRGTYSPEYYAPVESWGLYWHFVDIVWIFLLPLLYLIGTHRWSELHF